MAKSRKQRIVDVLKGRWTKAVVFLVTSGVMVSNSIIIKSPIIGIVSSIGFFIICSIFASSIFGFSDNIYLKVVLGFATFLVLLSLSGIFLILVREFTLELSMIPAIALGSILGLIALRKKAVETKPASENENDRKKEGRSYLFLVPLVLSLVVAFYALVSVRTGEGNISVWMSIPTYFLIAFFAASLSLMLVFFYSRGSPSFKLGMVSVFVFLSVSLFLLVWYPGRYGDPWAHLAEERFMASSGEIYAFDHLLATGLIPEIVKYRAQYALVIYLGRMFSVDLYWAQVFFIPVLWAIFMPSFSYKTAELMTKKKTTLFPLVSAAVLGLSAALVYWGAISVPNSLGFILLFFSTLSLLYWLSNGQKRFWLLALVGAVGTFLAHPQPGIFAFVFLLIGTVIRLRLHKALKFALCAALSLSYFAWQIVIEKYTYLPAMILDVNNFQLFLNQIISPVLPFAAIGLIYSLRSQRVNGKIVAALFIFYVTIILESYLSIYGIKGSRLDPGRLPVMADIFLVPFVALGIVVSLYSIKKGLSSLGKNVGSKTMPRALAVLLICLLVGVQSSLALHLAYPQQEIVEVQPAWYEINAVYYIDSTAPGRYIALSEPSFAELAGAFLGVDYMHGSNPRGMFGIPEWDFWSVEDWVQMTVNPSVNVMEHALVKAHAQVAYFVVSVRQDQATPDFNTVVEGVTQVLGPPDQVLGGGKLYIFKYSPLTPVEGYGPYVNVTYDDGALSENVQTKFAYAVKSEVSYNLTLEGHTAYNVTDYPNNWTFLELRVNGSVASLDDRSDINTFVYVSGRSISDTVTVKWQADERYPNVGWKDDSFKSGWQTHSLYTGSIAPLITADGMTLSLSWNFVGNGSYQYYYYMKRVGVLTDDFPYLQAKWRSSGPAAVVAVAYTDSENIMYAVVQWGSQSDDWSRTTVKLEQGKEVAYVMVGITNVNDRFLAGYMTVSIDYILLSAPP